MPTTFCNDARSKVAAGGGRSIGGTSITVEDGSKYQGTTGSAPSVGSPAKLTVIRWTSATDYIVVVVLLCTGRADNVLTIAGAADGYSDAAVLAGDYVMVGPTAGDMEAFQAAIATNAANIASNTTAIAGKQDALGAGSIGTPLLADYAVAKAKINPAARPFVDLGTFGTPVLAPGATGDAERGKVALVACTLQKVVLWATANPSGAGGGVTVQLKVAGSSVLSSSLTLAAGSTGPVEATEFTSASVPAGALVVPAISAIGGDVRGVTILPVARES